MGKTEERWWNWFLGGVGLEHVTVPCWFTACYHNHHQDVTLAGGRHMTAPPPSNGTGHLAIRPHHQLIVRITLGNEFT